MILFLIIIMRIKIKIKKSINIEKYNEKYQTEITK